MATPIKAFVFNRTTIFVLLSLIVGFGSWYASNRYITAQRLLDAEKSVEGRENEVAQEKLNTYLKDHPNDAKARLLAARTARRLKAYYDAKEHLRICGENLGDTEGIEVETALIDLQRGDERPVEWLRPRSLKDDALAQVILEVLIQHDLDTYQLWSALDGFKHYLSRRPDDLQALLGRARVWERFLYFKDALADYQAAVNAHPDNEIARFRLAETLLIVGTPDEALKEYRKLAQRFPSQMEVRLGLAKCNRQLGKADEARKLLDEIISEVPDNGEALWERGQLAAEDGKATEAEPLLRMASRLMPFDRRVNFSLYRCLLDLKLNDEAEKVNARVKKIDADIRRLDEVRQEVMKKPNDTTLRVEGGLLFLRNGERREGIRWLQHALKINPNLKAAVDALREAESSPQLPSK
jgi:tetratricopeptide (TPR) repeat protein